jgi:hypothetical protein
MERWTNKKQNKQTDKQTKNFRFRNNRISILVWVLVLLLQHPILVLVFKQKLCDSLARWWGSVWLSFFFFPSLSQADAQSVPPTVGCGSLSLYVVLRIQNQLCSPPAVLLWSWVFTVLDYWGLVSLPYPLSLGQGQWSITWPPTVSVSWWFADYFSILQCSLILDVAHWLSRWALWTITCPASGSSLSPASCWPLCLSILCLLKEWRSAASINLCSEKQGSTLHNLFFFFLLYSYVHIIFGSFLPPSPCPPPPLPPQPLATKQKLFCTYL